jgi:hypothetical protein
MKKEIYINATLRLPASKESVKNVEEKLALQLNSQHKEFLKLFDGGLLCDKNFLLFCAEENGFNGDDLIGMNGPERGEDRKKFIFIGRDAGETSFVMRKSELAGKAAPVYSYYGEDGSFEMLSEDFRGFIAKLAEHEVK